MPRARSRLIARFSPVPSAGASSGAGLGLAISRWIAKAHGGNIRLARSDASGTEFEVTLPTQGAHASSHPPTA